MDGWVGGRVERDGNFFVFAAHREHTEGGLAIDLLEV
jgi:hypothetical protein